MLELSDKSNKRNENNEYDNAGLSCDEHGLQNKIGSSEGVEAKRKVSNVLNEISESEQDCDCIFPHYENAFM